MLIKSAKISTPFGASPVSHNPRLSEPFGSADVVSRSITIIPSPLHRTLPFDEASLTNFCDWNRFLYDGQRIQDDDTPNSLDMEDNDTIDVMVERTFAFIGPLLISCLLLTCFPLQRSAEQADCSYEQLDE